MGRCADCRSLHRKRGGLQTPAGRRAYDALIVAVCIVSAAACGGLQRRQLNRSDDALYAVITVSGEETLRLDLRETQIVTLRGNRYTLELSVQENGIHVGNSDCPNQDCVHTGTIDTAGESIICLPAQICITLESESASSETIDAVIG